MMTVGLDVEDDGDANAGTMDDVSDARFPLCRGRTNDTFLSDISDSACSEMMERNNRNHDMIDSPPAFLMNDYGPPSIIYNPKAVVIGPSMSFYSTYSAAATEAGTVFANGDLANNVGGDEVSRAEVYEKMVTANGTHEVAHARDLSVNLSVIDEGEEAGVEISELIAAKISFSESQASVHENAEPKEDACNKEKLSNQDVTATESDANEENSFIVEELKKLEEEKDKVAVAPKPPSPISVQKETGLNPGFAIHDDVKLVDVQEKISAATMSVKDADIKSGKEVEDDGATKASKGSKASSKTGSGSKASSKANSKTSTGSKSSRLPKSLKIRPLKIFKRNVNDSMKSKSVQQIESAPDVTKSKQTIESPAVERCVEKKLDNENVQSAEMNPEDEFELTYLEKGPGLEAIPNSTMEKKPIEEEVEITENLPEDAFELTYLESGKTPDEREIELKSSNNASVDDGANTYGFELTGDTERPNVAAISAPSRGAEVPIVATYYKPPVDGVHHTNDNDSGGEIAGEGELLGRNSRSNGNDKADYVVNSKPKMKKPVNNSNDAANTNMTKTTLSSKKRGAKPFTIEYADTYTVGTRDLSLLTFETNTITDVTDISDDTDEPSIKKDNAWSFTKWFACGACRTGSELHDYPELSIASTRSYDVEVDKFTRRDAMEKELYQDASLNSTSHTSESTTSYARDRCELRKRSSDEDFSDSYSYYGFEVTRKHRERSRSKSRSKYNQGEHRVPTNSKSRKGEHRSNPKSRRIKDVLGMEKGASNKVKKESMVKKHGKVKSKKKDQPSVLFRKKKDDEPSTQRRSKKSDYPSSQRRSSIDEPSVSRRRIYRDQPSVLRGRSRKREQSEIRRRSKNKHQPTAQRRSKKTILDRVNIQVA